MHRLLAEADVFLTNTRVKALKKLGLDYDSLKDKYPRLIEANISGLVKRDRRKIILDLIPLHSGQAVVLTQI